MSDKNKQFLEWEAPEFQHYEKSLGWYAILIVATVLLVGYKIITADYFGATSMLILGALILFFSRRKPALVTVKLDNEGVTLGELYIPYQHFQHFWMVDTPEHKTLNLEASTYLKQTIIVELADQDPTTVRRLIARHIPEAEHTTPSFSQRIAHKLKF